MIYVLAFGLLVSLVINVINHLKIKRLITALGSTNASLNETRTEVAMLLKWRKHVLKSL